MKPEQALMMACNVYASHVLPPECDYAATEINTGRNDRIAGVFRKLSGAKKGQPDAQIVWRGRVTFIEFKAGASISPAQHKRHAELRGAGAEVFIIRSVATLHSVLVGLGVPLRFHAMTPETRDEALAARRANPKPARGRNPHVRGTSSQIAAGNRVSLAMARGK